MSFDVIDHRAKLVQKRRAIKIPMCLVIGEPFVVRRLSQFPLQLLHHGREDHGPFAPATEPAVTTEHTYL
jgi:hypothetical protein